MDIQKNSGETERRVDDALENGAEIAESLQQLFDFSADRAWSYVQKLS